MRLAAAAGALWAAAMGWRILVVAVDGPRRLPQMWLVLLADTAVVDLSTFNQIISSTKQQVCVKQQQQQQQRSLAHFV